MKKILLLLITVFITGFLFSQNANLQNAQQTLKERGEVYFKFTLDDAKLMHKSLLQLTRVISIDNVKGNEVYAYANSNEFKNFLDFKIDFDVLTPPSLLYKPTNLSVNATRNTDAWDFYPTYDEYINMMNQFATDYPSLCEVVNIGYSNEGRELLFIHINNDLSTAEGEPEFMYTSSIHGDELTGYVLMLRYIDYLLQNYGTNSEVTNLVDNIDIWINPLANPDGTFAGGNNTVWGATRTNANNIDMNRNYADPQAGPHPDGNEYQVETVAFMDFAEEHHFVMSCNMHGGAEVVNYPWDTWSELSPDNDWWYMVSRQYADIVHDNSPAGYLTDRDNGITNGYAWYSITGGRQDYMNYFQNCREVTLEISSAKTPPENQLPNFWEYNYRSFNKYMEQSMYGFSGIVTNELTGDPIEAKVFIDNHDDVNTWVYSYLPNGNYHRPVFEGSYDVTFSSYGYYDKTIVDVSVSNESITELNVELTPYTSLTADFTASTTTISTGGSIDFTDNSWGNDIVSWQWTFEGGTPATSSERNPTGIVYSETGDFDVTLIVTDQSGDTDTKLKENYIHASSSYNMSNETVTTCNALFLDSGGENSNYSDDEDLVMTFLPGETNSSVKMEFIEFNVETQASCNYDYLEIYDGNSIIAPVIGRWCGTSGPGTVIATNDDGALTMYFHSDNSVNLPGWKAIVTCDSNVGVVDNQKANVLVFPNPATSEVRISSNSEILNITLSDISGRVVYYLESADKSHSINTGNFDRGIYLLSFNSRNDKFTKKIVLN